MVPTCSSLYLSLPPLPVTACRFRTSPIKNIDIHGVDFYLLDNDDDMYETNKYCLPP